MAAPEEAADEIELTEEQWQVVDFIVRRYKLCEPPTSAPSGVEMPDVIVPAAGFLVTPDEGELICRGCATQGELDDLDLADLRVAGAASEDDADG
jgi:hypothetical protein